MMKIQTLLLTFLLLFPAMGLAEQTEDDKPGQVQLPLAVYKALLDKARDPSRLPRPAPASYALGNARVSVQVAATEPRISGQIRVDLAIDVLEDDWVLVPVLPAGTPVEAATIGGNPIQLLATPEGLAWSTKKSGSYNMNLLYRVDAMRSDAGFTLAVPLPQAAATQLTASLPGSGLDVAVIPAAGVKFSQSGQTTRVSATIPTTSGVQISWRTPARRGHTVSRASYSGRLVGNAVDWSGRLSVELFSDETATLSLLPRSVTMSNLKVDGKDAPILVEGDRFVTLVKGRGVHSVVVEFQVPVLSGDGPPRVNLQVPPVPVSRFDLTLPGKKELTVTPAASIRSRIRDGSTIATVHVPLTGQVSFAWSEAVPEDIKAEVRSNASLYHVLHAEEGVLNGRVTVQYEVNRGETHVIELAVPDDVQINRISAESGAVADWRLNAVCRGARTVTVFLDRQLKGQLLFDIFYDRSLAPSAEQGGIQAPLFQALGVQRQKGMLALLASHELALSPVGEPDETQATRVGENQLPAFVRNEVTMTVAHTFKYADALPRVMVETSTPEVVQGKFDAQVDTLISLGEVTMTGAASLEIHLKSGRVSSLELELPEGINLLSLTAPSLRTYAVNPGDDNQLVSIEFTQEMEGQFRLELTYERILVDDTSEVEVPTLTVRGAEVEQGRIAIEALSAAEIQPATTEQLSAIDIKDLPQQLILRTTNPILLAYKYVHADPPHRLALNVTRHRVLGTQEAVIDRADYRTLFTRDGLFVTTAHFVVRNSRKQFLRVQLPERSQIWSVFVNGKPENPARSDGDDEEETPSVLIKILNSTRGFPVQIVYATEGASIRRLGKVEAALPRPDILVTESRWDAYLPAEMRYGAPSTNMDIVRVGAPVSASELEAEFARLGDAAGAQQALEPLRITVPTSGVHYAFEKLYANQSDHDAWFSVPYSSAGGAFAGQLANLLGIALFWTGIWLSRRADAPLEPRRALAVAGAGATILLITIGFYHVSATLPMVLSVLVGLGLAARHGKAYVAQLRHSFADEKPQGG